MKLIKNLGLLWILVLALLLVGCGSGSGNQTPKKTLEEVKTEVLGAFNAYSAAEHGSYKLTVNNGEASNVVDVTFNYETGKYGIVSLKTLLTNANGTLSVYVTEDLEVYTDRYGQSKTYTELDDDQNEALVEDYGFNQFNEYLILLLNNSFFANAELNSFENNVAKVTLNIGTYNIDSEEENEVLTTIFDGIKESNEVVLEVTYTENVVSNIKVTIVRDTTSTMSLDLLGTSDANIAIEFPDFSNYTEQK